MKKISIILLAMLLSLAVQADEGMWLLSLLGKNMKQMQAQGCKLTAEDIYSVNKASLKDAVVGLGNVNEPFRYISGGVIVSGNGLVLTNYRPGLKAIQKYSTLEHDYLSNGFWACKLSDELPHKDITASVLERIEDVTDRVNTVLNADMPEAEREDAIFNISKKMVKEAVKGTNLQAQVVNMFEGNQFFLFVYRIYEDIRLVGISSRELSKLEKDTNRQQQLRYKADFCMLRIYTAPDGESAPYSPDNIPLKPKSSLPVSEKGIKKGDFSMMIGFPGSTDRFLTSSGIKEVINVTNTICYKVYSEKSDILKKFMNTDPKIYDQYVYRYDQCIDKCRYYQEQNTAVKRLNILKGKEKSERKFMAWIEDDPARQAKYGNVLVALEEDYKVMDSHLKDVIYLMEAGYSGGRIAAFSVSNGNTIKNCQRKDIDERLRKYFLDIAWNSSQAFFQNCNINVEKELIARLLKLLNDNMREEYQPEVIEMVNKVYQGDFEKYASEIVNKSIFTDSIRFKVFFEKPDIKRMFEDPGYVLGKSLFDAYSLKLQPELIKTQRKITRSTRLFIEGLLEMQPEKMRAPNANSTIRLTYGNVKDANTDNTKVNFITNNDIVGGCSGSPLINGSGELIGIVCDRNSDMLPGEIDFRENYQGCTGLDVRHVLFVLDKIAGAQNLITEMTILD